MLTLRSKTNRIVLNMLKKMEENIMGEIPYKIYLEAIEIYKKAMPKKLSDERNQLLSEARNKLNEAKEAMKNLK